MNYAFLTKNHKFLEFSQTSILTFGYPGFQKKKRFCDKPIFKTRVKVNVHQVGPPTQILVTTKDDRTKSKKWPTDLPVTPTVSEPCVVFTCHFWDLVRSDRTKSGRTTRPNFRCNRTLTHVLEKRKEGKRWNFYTECMNKWPTQVCARHLKILLLGECWHDVEKVILSKFWVVYINFMLNFLSTGWCILSDAKRAVR